MKSDFALSSPQPGEGYDGESLFWRHERLHRLVLGDYSRRKDLFNAERLALEAKFASLDENSSSDATGSSWEEHRSAILDWTARVEGAGARSKNISLFSRYWREQKKLDRIPDAAS